MLVFQISLKIRYESPEAFSKAFRKAHGISPSEAKQTGKKGRAGVGNKEEAIRLLKETELTNQEIADMTAKQKTNLEKMQQ